MSTISEAMNVQNVKPQHIIPLDFDSISTIPDSHSWPQETITSDSDCANNNLLSIPIVDLNDPKVVDQIGHACESWGAFYLTNHGVPLDLVNEVESQARRLFSLPTEQKLKALRSPGAGASGYGKALVSQFVDKDIWHEGFTIVGSPLDHVIKLWPHDHHNFCKIMEDYKKMMCQLAKTLMVLITRYLRIPEEELKWVTSPEFNNTSTLQLNSYPLCPDPNRVMGLTPHTDTALLAILHQTSNGLQIFQEEVGWMSVRPASTTSIGDTFVVNVGDLLHIMSNGKFISPIHRVIMVKEAQKQSRLSVVHFQNPPANLVVPSVCYSSFKEVARYRTIAVGEYVGLKAKYREKALSFVRM